MIFIEFLGIIIPFIAIAFGILFVIDLLKNYSLYLVRVTKIEKIGQGRTRKKTLHIVERRKKYQFGEHIFEPDTDSRYHVRKVAIRKIL